MHYAPAWLSLCVDSLLELVQPPTQEGSQALGTRPSGKPLPLGKRLFHFIFAVVPPMRRTKKLTKTGSSEESSSTAAAGTWKTGTNRQAAARKPPPHPFY